MHSIELMLMLLHCINCFKCVATMTTVEKAGTLWINIQLYIFYSTAICVQNLCVLSKTENKLGLSCANLRASFGLPGFDLVWYSKFNLVGLI